MQQTDSLNALTKLLYTQSEAAGRSGCHRAAAPPSTNRLRTKPAWRRLSHRYVRCYVYHITQHPSFTHGHTSPLHLHSYSLISRPYISTSSSLIPHSPYNLPYLLFPHLTLHYVYFHITLLNLIPLMALTSSHHSLIPLSLCLSLSTATALEFSLF